DNSAKDTVWLNGLDELVNQKGGIDIKKMLNVGLATFTPTSNLDIYLQQQKPIDSLSMKDLSCVNNYYASANSYVINGPGWYKFPCWIMGNGLNSSVSSSYNLSSLNPNCYSHVSPLFVNYKGDSIRNNTDLILETSNASAELLWMDAPELVTKVQLSEDKNYIFFYVGPETIRQGNAVIAIRDDSNKIMWSWHIWVNEWALPIVNYDRYANFFGNALGVCYPGEYYYGQRSVIIQFVQDSSNVTTEIKLTQTPKKIQVYLNSPYYQWGRKDPMLSSDGINSNKPSYGPHQFTIKNGPATLEDAIQNPNVFYTSSKDWNVNSNPALWGEWIKSYPKTIYDPSPTGFVVPSGMIYDELTPTQWFPDYPGFGFKYGDAGNLSTVIFMVFGYRSASNGNINDITSMGYYWANGNPATSPYYYLNVSSGGRGYGSTGSANGYSIMPVQNSKFP
ncbi:MAG: hypothetical protein ACRCSQ_04730, partial [Bacteroidales bacterium]